MKNILPKETRIKIITECDNYRKFENDINECLRELESYGERVISIKTEFKRESFSSYYMATILYF